jgi:two-component system, OmpR family, KDP operon response regulator KdpE
VAVGRLMGARLLVVDDEQSILRAVRANLTRHGYEVETAESGRQALEQFTWYHPDLVMLDLGLPDMDGLEVIRRIREQSPTPIIVLSVRGAERDKVAALDLGADDYLTKPFGIDELLARVRVGLRHVARLAGGRDSVARVGELEVDFGQRRVLVGDEEVHLSPTEFALLKALVTNANKVLTDRMLLQQVWGPGYGAEAHYLHVYVARLRKKIERDPQKPRYLITEPGVGYRLLTDEP